LLSIARSSAHSVAALGAVVDAIARRAPQAVLLSIAEVAPAVGRSSAKRSSDFGPVSRSAIRSQKSKRNESFAD
jgi:hypothetical protein